MSEWNRNKELSNFISELVYADQHEDISWADKLKILTLYEHDYSSTSDTMCTDFGDVHAKLIIQILNNKATSVDKELLIDELYMNIECEVNSIIENEVQLKVECDDDYECNDDHYDECA